MKIQVTHTQSGISFYVVGPYGSAKIGTQPLNEIALGKRKAVKTLDEAKKIALEIEEKAMKKLEETMGDL